jgi:hypothetical protein
MSEQSESITRLCEYELSLVCQNAIKRYCDNCGEMIEYPRPGEMKIIWKKIVVSVDKRDPDFISATEQHLCEKCVRVREEKYRQSPHDNMYFDVSEEWEKIIQEERVYRKELEKKDTG